MRTTHLLSIALLVGGVAVLSIAGCEASVGEDAGAAGAGGSAGGSAGAAGSTAGGAAGSTAGGAAGSTAGGAAGSTAGGAAGAGGEAGGAGGGAGGSGPGTGAVFRIANMVAGYKANPVDICFNDANDKWADVQPFFKTQNGGSDKNQFISPTVSTWLQAQKAGKLYFRFVKADSDCTDANRLNTADWEATLDENTYPTFVLGGSTVDPKSPLELYQVDRTAAGSATLYSNITNAGTMGIELVTIAGTTASAAGISGVAPYKSGTAAVPAGSYSFGIRRGDNKLVLSFNGATIDDPKTATPSKTFTHSATSRYTIFTSGTNENAEKASNNLPWIIVCDDDSTGSMTGTTLVANCDYSQGRQFGYSDIK